MGVRMLLQNRRFLAYLTASVLADFGEGIFALTSIVLLMRDSGSVLAIGTMYVITMLPSVLLAPLGGVLIDRYNKAAISVVASLGRLLLIGLLPLLMVLQLFSTTMLFVVLFFGYIAWYVLLPTNESMLKDILREDEYVRGMSLTQAAWQVGLLSSGLLAGVLMKYAGLPMTLLVAALMYLLAAVLFWQIRGAFRENRASRGARKESGVNAGMGDEQGSYSADPGGAANERQGLLNVRAYLQDMREGFLYIGRTKKVFWFSLTACMFQPFVTSVNILLGPFTYHVIHRDEFALGVLDSAAGIGSLVSAFLCLWLAGKRGLPMYTLLSTLLLGASTVWFGMTSGYGMAFVLYVLVGIFMGNLKVLSKSLVFQYVEPAFVGRTMTTISMLSLALAIVYSLVVGWLGERSIGLAYTSVALSLVVPMVFVLLGKMQIRRDAYPLHFQDQTEGL